MDPDMVRQQAEAEREALALLQKKPAPAAILRATSPEAAPAAVLEAEPSALRLEQVSQRTGYRTAVQIGRAIAFGLAGAMLGGGLGILAANYMQLPAGLAKLAIYGPAALLASVCAIASVYTKTSHE
jgi:hypothetical protein